MQALTADLGVFTLANLLQAAHSDMVSGELLFDPEGSIVLYQGDVVDAVYGRLSGIDAALTLLMVHSNHVAVESYKTEEQKPLADLMALIIDGARMNDDWATLADRVMQPREDLETYEMSRPLRRALGAMNGRRIVEDVLDMMGLDVITVLDDLLELRERGDIIEVAPPRPSEVRVGTATPAPVRASPDQIGHDAVNFYELVDQSRIALRNKDYRRALSLLEQASAQRPDDRIVLQNIRLIEKFINQN